MPFQFFPLDIPEVIVVVPKVFPDGRGFFMETYKKTDFEKGGITKPFVQVNRSQSEKNVLRGLHFQNPPMAQAKLVSVIRGGIFDVAVDIRKGSPYYGQWVGVSLSEENKKALYVPEGFAHGFCVLSDTAEVTYSCTNVYSPEHEAGIIWNDPTINIEWPVKEPLLSPRDENNVLLKDLKTYFEYE